MISFQGNQAEGYSSTMREFLNYITIICVIPFCLEMFVVHHVVSTNISPRGVLGVQFPKCHLMFTSRSREQVPGRINYLVSSALGLRTTFSSFNMNHYLHKNRSSHFGLKFTQCFVHVCMEDDFTFTKRGNCTSYANLLTHLNFFTVLWGFRHHYLFYVNLWSYSASNYLKKRLNFYRESLHQTVAKGLILSITHDQNLTLFRTQLVCIFCQDPMIDIDINKVQSIKFHEGIQFRKNSQVLQRQFHVEDWPTVKQIVDQYCDFHRLRPVFASGDPLYCMHAIFLPSYNATLAPPKAAGYVSVIPVKAKSNYVINWNNFKINVNRGFLLVPFFFRNSPWKFTAY